MASRRRRGRRTGPASGPALGCGVLNTTNAPREQQARWRPRAARSSLRSPRPRCPHARRPPAGRAGRRPSRKRPEARSRGCGVHSEQLEVGAGRAPGRRRGERLVGSVPLLCRGGRGRGREDDRDDDEELRHATPQSTHTLRREHTNAGTLAACGGARASQNRRSRCSACTRWRCPPSCCWRPASPCCRCCPRRCAARRSPRSRRPPHSVWP